MGDDPSKLLEIKNFEDLVGQEHLFKKNKPLYIYYNSNISLLSSLILFGPPGTGKTSYTKILAEKHKTPFYHVNATSTSSQEIRNILNKGTNKNSILILIDEIHRLDKKQQEILLPYLEEKKAILIGTSTENPYFRLSKALRSRSFVYEFKPLSESHLKILLERAKNNLSLNIDNDAINYCIMAASHDARRLYNILILLKDKKITKDLIKNQFNIDIGYNSQTERYDIISAFIKSIRGSDPDSALYYLARMLKANEDIAFIARRLCILASEDIGLANPNAISVASSALTIVKEIGLPEAKITLSHCTIYLSLSKKSNSCYTAINRALDDVKAGNVMDVPEYLRSHPKGVYLYPHNFKGSYVKQKYTLKSIKYFQKKENDLMNMDLSND